MPIIIRENEIIVCLGNNEFSPLCGFAAGEVCEGCEDYKAKEAEPFKIPPHDE